MPRLGSLSLDLVILSHSPLKIVCPAIWAPVCGSNGKTYTNKCRLEVASCRSLQQDGPAIELKSEGVCGETKAAREAVEECPVIILACKMIINLSNDN